METKKRNTYRDLTASGICLALCIVLPFLTGQIPQIGNALSPMHIPVLLCGFISGPFYAAAVGAIAPFLRFILFSMPPFFPTVIPTGAVVCGAAMCFEMAVYGLSAGLLYKLLPKKLAFTYVSLIISMVLGRVVWGIAMYLILGVAALPFSFEAFIAGAFINAVPGIILHIAVIPVIVLALKKARLME
ncbi:MAG: ECF transporter S component [Oscillospiraceae bacterium]|nr:ECF transporter S component [Oscillospiraceae bacterium]